MATVNLFGDLALEATADLTRVAAQATASTVAVRGAVASASAPGVPAIAIRRDSDTIGVAADGDYSMLHTEEEGRLKVSTKPGSFVPVVGVANTVGSAVVADVSRASNVVFHIKNIGSVTLLAGTFYFEASIDSTNGTDGSWFAIQVVRTNSNTIETNVPLGSVTAGNWYGHAWEASVNGYTWLRLRCSVAVTASASAQWTIVRGSYATEPIPAAQVSATQPVNGTVTANIGSGTGSQLTTTASTNGANIRNVAASLHSIIANNPTATPAYLKLYNKNSAPTVGTDVPVLTLEIPANGTLERSYPPIGVRFTAGISRAITGARADTDTTNAVAGVTSIITWT